MPLIGNQSAFEPKKPSWWIGLLLSSWVALLFYLATSKSIEHDAGERFKNLARTAQNGLAAHIKSYGDLLRATTSMFQLNGTINREQFHRYVTNLALKQHFPAVETINYAPFVSQSELPAFVAMIRREDRGGADGYPPFHLSPPGRHATYSILTLIEPIENAAQRFGMNITADPMQEKAMELAPDNGATISAGNPILIPQKQDIIGMSIRLPVYRSGAPTASVAERRAAFIGSAGIGFNLRVLVQEVLSEMPLRQVRLMLYASGAGISSADQIEAGDQLLLDTGAVLPPEPWWKPSHVNQSFSTILPIDYNGHLWKEYFSVSINAMYTRFDAYFPWLSMLAGFVGSMLIFALFHTLAASRLHAIRLAKDMTQELRDSQARLQLSHQKLRRLGAHAEQIKEEERKRIAREIHDDLGQNLLVLRIEADMLATRTEYKHPRLHARARGTLEQIDATIKSVRQIINDLRPNVLDLGLNAAVEWQIAEFRRRTGIVCELNDNQPEIHVSDHCATAFFRILQESLSNITQHANASLVQVELRQAGQRLSMRVRDNGIGMPMEGRSKAASFGLVGIEERMRILGGQFSITSAPGSGTTIHVSVPIEAGSPDSAFPSETQLAAP